MSRVSASSDIARQHSRNEIGIGVATQGSIQFDQFAALALPAHPDVLLLIEAASAMQEKEVSSSGVDVTLVKDGNLSPGISQQFLIVLVETVGRIHPVTQQGIIELATRIGEKVHLKISDEVIDRVA